jgi:excinuclease UvrABC ATPase subunit
MCDQDNVYDPSQFLKCPNCHRTGNVKITIHIDGDFTIECSACEAMGFGRKLHQSDQTYE